MMPRKNPMTRIGRPPAMKMKGSPMAGPMAGLDPAVPGAAFKYGGPVAHHDDPRMAKSCSEHGFASARTHFGKCRGGKV